MDYFRILNLNKEPFSNSPDPEFFFHSRQHQDCLQKLELSLLLRRGLNIVIGDVGTGKTTMCRQLIRRFAQKAEIETHLILDPHVLNATEFLATVNEMFTGHKLSADNHELQIKEQIKKHLFRKGVDDDKTVVLIIDEGQKIPTFCLEILREFLNYETNEYKLLQIVIFAQTEFESVIRKYPNFADRINLLHLLQPLNFRDTRSMIKFRLEKSSGTAKRLRLFTLPALWMIYRISGGYPRKIINLCHQSILAMIIQNRSKCGYRLVRTCARRVFPEESNRRRLIWTAATAAVAIFMAWLVLMPLNPIQWLQKGLAGRGQTVLTRDSDQKAGMIKPDNAAQTSRAQIVAPEFDNRQSTPGKTGRGLTNGDEAAAAPTSDPGRPRPPDIPAKSEIPTVSRTEPAAEKPFGPRPAASQPLPQPTALAVEADSSAGDESVTAAASETDYAPILGQITLKRNETLSRVIKGVYGNFNSRYFKSLIIANPDIEDPDRVNVGQIISLPAIPARVVPVKDPVWWVSVGDPSSLEAAFDMLRRLANKSPGMRLIPHWNPSDGTRFAVLLDELFFEESAARRRLQQLTGELADNPSLVTQWDRRTVYFANPYFK